MFGFTYVKMVDLNQAQEEVLSSVASDVLMYLIQTTLFLLSHSKMAMK
jgi:hypothetical protein